MKLKHNITINDSGFAFDAKTGDSYSLNTTAREIVKLIELGRSETEIKAYFMTKYDVSENIFERHLDDYFQMLNHYHLIVND